MIRRSVIFFLRLLLSVKSNVKLSGVHAAFLSDRSLITFYDRQLISTVATTPVSHSSRSANHKSIVEKAKTKSYFYASLVLISSPSDYMTDTHPSIKSAAVEQSDHRHEFLVDSRLGPHLFGFLRLG